MGIKPWRERIPSLWKKWNQLSANSRISSPQKKLSFRVCKIYKKTKKTERCQVLWLKDEILHGRYFIIPAGDQGEVFSVLHHSCIHQFLSVYTFLSHMKKNVNTQPLVMGIFTKLENYYFDKVPTRGECNSKKILGLR